MVSKTSIAKDTHPIFQCARAQSALQEPHEQQPPSLSDPMKHCDATLVQHYEQRASLRLCTRWPTSVTAQLTVSRHNLLSHGTTYFLTVQLAFFMAQLTFSRHNLLSHCKFFFFIANITFLLVAAQLLSHGTTNFCHGGGQFSRRKCRESGQKNPIPTRPGSPPKSFSFSIMAWTMKMWCKYELFIFSLSYLNILKGLLLACI